jgi:hypothetical protein
VSKNSGQEWLKIKNCLLRKRSCRGSDDVFGSQPLFWRNLGVVAIVIFAVGVVIFGGNQLWQNARSSFADNECEEGDENCKELEGEPFYDPLDDLATLFLISANPSGEIKPGTEENFLDVTLVVGTGKISIDGEATEAERWRTLNAMVPFYDCRGVDWGRDDYNCYPGEEDFRDHGRYFLFYGATQNGYGELCGGGELNFSNARFEEHEDEYGRKFIKFQKKCYEMFRVNGEGEVINNSEDGSFVFRLMALNGKTPYGYTMYLTPRLYDNDLTVPYVLGDGVTNAAKIVARGTMNTRTWPMIFFNYNRYLHYGMFTGWTYQTLSTVLSYYEKQTTIKEPPDSAPADHQFTARGEINLTSDLTEEKVWASRVDMEFTINLKPEDSSQGFDWIEATRSCAPVDDACWYSCVVDKDACVLNPGDSNPACETDPAKGCVGEGNPKHTCGASFTDGGYACGDLDDVNFSFQPSEISSFSFAQKTGIPIVAYDSLAEAKAAALANYGSGGKFTKLAHSENCDQVSYTFDPDNSDSNNPGNLGELAYALVKSGERVVAVKLYYTYFYQLNDEVRGEEMPSLNYFRQWLSQDMCGEVDYYNKYQNYAYDLTFENLDLSAIMPGMSRKLRVEVKPTFYSLGTKENDLVSLVVTGNATYQDLTFSRNALLPPPVYPAVGVFYDF